jgi:hypothetical protein
MWSNYIKYMYEHMIHNEIHSEELAYANKKEKLYMPHGT